MIDMLCSAVNKTGNNSVLSNAEIVGVLMIVMVTMMKMMVTCVMVDIFDENLGYTTCPPMETDNCMEGLHTVVWTCLGLVSDQHLQHLSIIEDTTRRKHLI